MVSEAELNFILDWVINNEGGYVNDPDDAGGATNYGISLRFINSLPDNKFKLFKDFSADDIKNITKEQAKSLYIEYFWKPFLFAHIKDIPICAKFFDMSVNMGIKQATRLVQLAINEFLSPMLVNEFLSPTLVIDGIFGTKTLNKINVISSIFPSICHCSCKCEQRFLCVLKEKAAQFYLNLVEHDKKKNKYLKGWLKRAYSLF